MALYGTYRPHNFSTLVGQESIKTTLLNASAHKRISHASLFCGTRGTGKTTSARIVAKALDCQNLLPSGDPCLKCEFCTAAEEGRMTDIIEIDAASNRGIDEIRDLREKVNFSPNFGTAKIYIIDEVHMLTKEAFNALLKTLEEPPAHAYFILATTEFHKVPETIRSRCQTFFFRKISTQDIVARLEFICEKEGISADRKGLEIIAQRANGGLRDAISLLEQSASYGEISEKNLQESLGMISGEIFENFLETLSTGNSTKALSLLDSLQDEGRNLEEFGKDFLGVLRKKFHEFLHARDGRLPWILQVIDIFESALQKCRNFDIPPLAFELAIAESMLLQKEFVDQLSVTTIISQVQISPDIRANIEHKVVDKIVSEKNHIKKVKDEITKEKVTKTTEDYLEEKARQEKKEVKEVVKIQKSKNSPPWEDAENFPSDEFLNETPAVSAPISKYDDDDMFPSADTLNYQTISQPVSSQKNKPENNKKEKTEKISGNFEENLKKHWNDLLSLLPKSVGTMVKTYGKLSHVGENLVSICIESDSTRKFLSSEKNIQKISEVFSEKFEKQITVEFISQENDEEKISVSEKKISPVTQKMVKNTPEIEVSEMEEMLKF